MQNGRAPRFAWKEPSMDNLEIFPDLVGFTTAALTPGTRVVSVYTRLLADDLTPVGLYHQLCGKRPGTFLFESADNGQWARYSFVGVSSAATLTEVDGHAEWQWADREIEGLPTGGDPLEVLRRTIALLSTPTQPELPPFTSGMVGYLGYDVIRRLEDLPDSNPDDVGVPEMVMMLASDIAVLDHHTGEVWLIANVLNFDGSDDRIDEAWADGISRVKNMAAGLRQSRVPLLVKITDGDTESTVTRQRTPVEFRKAVSRAIELIDQGEIQQVVISQRFETPNTADALDVYRALRRTNPSPYLFLIRFDEWAIAGSSPESLVTVMDGRATTKPIAGTRPRGLTPILDLALEAELLADPKERSEHMMLVELGREDLGRVCVPGTVEAVEIMKVRRYSHVMHLEATVVGELDEGVTALDATLACFPAGTLTGAPRVRAMQIIDDLETSRRGVYGGAVGYFDFAGNSDVAIAIRTAVLKDGVAHVQSGAGIVAESSPEAEDTECVNKARAGLDAVRRAGAMRRLSDD